VFCGVTLPLAVAVVQPEGYRTLDVVKRRFNVGDEEVVEAVILSVLKVAVVKTTPLPTPMFRAASPRRVRAQMEQIAALAARRMLVET
jgi:hypothetical protein